MSTDATSAQPKKRMRFDDTTISQTTQDQAPTASKSPTAAAKSYVQSRTESLQESIQELTIKKADLYIRNMKNIYENKKRIEKLDEIDYVPNSCRINFNLQSKTEVKDTQQFSDLQEETKTEVAAFQSKLKKLVQASVCLELLNNSEKLKQTVADGILKISTAMMLQNRITTTPELITSLVEHILQTNNKILEYTDLKDSTIVNTIKSLLLSPETLPMETEEPENYEERTTTEASETSTPNTPTIVNPYAKSTMTSPNATSQDIITQPSEPTVATFHPGPYQSTIVPLSQLLYDIFNTTWHQFLSKIQENELKIELAKYTKSELQLQATEQASEILQNEPPADTSTIEKLIDSKLNQKLKKRDDKINQIQQKINRSNHKPPRNQQHNNKKSKNDESNDSDRRSTNNQRSKSPKRFRNNNNRNKNRNRQNNNNNSEQHSDNRKSWSSNRNHPHGQRERKRSHDDNSSVTSNDSKNRNNNSNRRRNWNGQKKKNKHWNKSRNN